MKPHEGYQGVLIEKELSKITDQIVIESPLQININGSPFTVIMQTPGNEIELCVGLLYNEDIINSYSEHLMFTNEVSDETKCISEINLECDDTKLGPAYNNSRTLLSVSSCGICGKKELKDIEIIKSHQLEKATITSKDIHSMYDVMRDQQTLFKETGGSHACGLFDLDHNMLSVMEDIGRHNAVDTAIGQLLMANTIAKAKIMLVSGRISYEIVSKAFSAKTPILVAVSAPSSLAIDYAKELGITLIGFCRNDRLTCYSHPEAINL